MSAALVVRCGQCANNRGEDRIGSSGQFRRSQQLNRMLDIEHAAGGHGEQAGLLNRFVSKRRRGDANRGNAAALQVN